MILFLLKYWKFAAGAVPIALIAFALHNWRVDVINAAHARQIEQVKAEAVKGWEDAQKITYEVSNDYQKQLADLRRRLDARRMQPHVCVPVAPANPGGRDAATGAGPVRADGVDSQALLDFAAEAEGYRLRLSACQDFIRKTWASRGQ